jgi:hypothetical protein
MQLKSRLALIGAASVAALVLSPATAVADGGHNLIRGDLTPSLPGDASINGVGPGGKPWILDRGEVRVRESGRMDVRIEGLQIPAPFLDPTLDVNPIANIHAVLYCSGAAAADSGSQPMSVPGGDSRFRVSLMVPETCADAVVLIQPDSTLTPGTRANAYIASLVAMGDEDD